MNILILSLPLHVNYGGILQAFALQTVLTRMGHSVSVIDWPMCVELPPLHKRWFVYLRRLVGKLLNKKESVVRWEYYQNQLTKQERKYTQPFIDQYIKRTIINCFEDLNLKNIDAIVVGSDQVWRPLYFKTLWNTPIEDAFLSFCNDQKLIKIAYAPSFGSEKWEYNEVETLHCKRLLAGFRAVSVRENTGVELCVRYFNRHDVVRMPDPTLLIDVQYYVERFKLKEYDISLGRLLNYILDSSDRTIGLVHHFETTFNYKSFKVNSEVESDCKDVESRIQPPVEQWLRGFYDAELIITDSFHACVFSILFNKPFFVLCNQNRGIARIESLLSVFNLKHCIIRDIDKLPDHLPIIDWNYVNNIISRERSKGLSFLQKYLQP